MRPTDREEGFSDGWDDGYSVGLAEARRTMLSDEAVEAAAKAIADRRGHGMREKCKDDARAALEAVVEAMEGRDG